MSLSPTEIPVMGVTVPGRKAMGVPGTVTVGLSLTGVIWMLTVLLSVFDPPLSSPVLPPSLTVTVSVASVADAVLPLKSVGLR